MLPKIAATVLVLPVLYAVAAPAALPSIKLDDGVFTGTELGNVQRFYGIPFAKPPVGDLRFRLPVANDPYKGNFDATKWGAACPQQKISLPVLKGLASEAVDFIVNSIYGQVFPDDEDCLTLNIVKPRTATPTSKLPVVVWIFGGGFQIGSPSLYDGGGIVSRSIELGSPVIHVSMHYRLSGFGFMPGKEIKDAGVGNIGLYDQREAFKWVRKYISNFGGDPDKVTIWGESAGAISVAMHMLHNGGNPEGLFRAGFMQSGAPIPVGDISNGQSVYDQVVADAGCSRAGDTLQCLRGLPYKQLKAAIDKSPGIFSYQSLRLPYLPRVDGKFLTDNPQKLVQAGRVAKVPYVNGNCDDEGTLFALSTLNLTTSSQVRNWIKGVFLPEISVAELEDGLDFYPQDITQGSPFDTGIFNAISPQFKRLAAFLGDGVFQGPRRWMLQHTVSTNPNVWAFINKRLKALPVLGSGHATDLLNVYGGGDMADYLIRFSANLDPNRRDGGGFQWPKYTLRDRKLLTFRDSILSPLTTTTDNFRAQAMELLTQVTLKNPI